jgi:hypothetical protein
LFLIDKFLNNNSIVFFMASCRSIPEELLCRHAPGIERTLKKQPEYLLEKDPAQDYIVALLHYMPKNHQRIRCVNSLGKAISNLSEKHPILNELKSKGITYDSKGDSQDLQSIFIKLGRIGIVSHLGYCPGMYIYSENVDEYLKNLNGYFNSDKLNQLEKASEDIFNGISF